MTDSISLKKQDNKNETESLESTEEIFIEIPKTMKHFSLGSKRYSASYRIIGKRMTTRYRN